MAEKARHFGDFLAHRLPWLIGKSAFFKPGVSAESRAEGKDMPEGLPAPERHLQLLSRVWQEMVDTGEDAAWGECWVDAGGRTRVRCFGKLARHSLPPPMPELRVDAVAVIMRRNPYDPEDRPEAVPATARVAEEILNARREDLRLPHWHARVMDGPFQHVQDLISPVTRMMIEGEPGEETALGMLREEALDFYGEFCRQASILLSAARDSESVHVSDWLALLSLGMSLTSICNEFSQTAPEAAARRDRRLARVKDQAAAPRTKSPHRERLIQAIVACRRRGLSKRQALDELQRIGALKHDGNEHQKASHYEIRHGKMWDRPKSIRTFDAMWQEAGKITRFKPDRAGA